MIALSYYCTSLFNCLLARLMTYPIEKKSVKNPNLAKNPRTISEALDRDRVDRLPLMLNMLTLNMDLKVALLPSLENEISLDPSRRPEPSIKNGKWSRKKEVRHFLKTFLSVMKGHILLQ